MDNLYIDILNAIIDKFYKDSYGEIYKIIGINCHPKEGLKLNCLKQSQGNKHRIVDFPLDKKTLEGLERLAQSEANKFSDHGLGPLKISDLPIV